MNGKTLCCNAKQGSIIADPLFVDPASGDYRVREDSPARKLGITGVDARDFGVTQENPFVKKVK